MALVLGVLAGVVAASWFMVAWGRIVRSIRDGGDSHYLWAVIFIGQGVVVYSCGRLLWEVVAGHRD